MDIFLEPSTWMGLLTLTILELVLGIDNIVFVSILSGKLHGAERERARKIGMTLAIIPRVLLLLGIGWLVKASSPVFDFPLLASIASVSGAVSKEALAEASGVSIKDLVMFGGGFFLIYKSVKEIHHKLEGVDPDAGSIKAKNSFRQVIMSILVINIIFSLDSVITAVGMTDKVPVMILAVLISGLFMVFYSKFISDFVEKHPTIKILALSFLVLIGTNLLADGGGIHVPKGYTYFAMAFAVIVEVVNIKVRSSSNPVDLHELHPPAEQP